MVDRKLIHRISVVLTTTAAIPMNLSCQAATIQIMLLTLVMAMAIQVRFFNNKKYFPQTKITFFSNQINSGAQNYQSSSSSSQFGPNGGQISLQTSSFGPSGSQTVSHMSEFGGNGQEHQTQTQQESSSNGSENFDIIPQTFVRANDDVAAFVAGQQNYLPPNSCATC